MAITIGSERTERRASFDELFGFYRDSGFLYPAKLAALAPRLTEIEQTWRALLAAEPHLFRLCAKRAGDGRLLNAICAFTYAPGTWQAQHLVSLRRHEYTGTLQVLSALVRWLNDAGVQHTRLCFRPNNPGTNHLFGAITRTLPPHLAHASIVDYGVVRPGAERLPAAGAAVERLGRADAQAAIDFYRRILHPVELGSLQLEDLEQHCSDPASLPATTIASPATGRTSPDTALAAAPLAAARDSHDDAVLTLAPADRGLALEAGLIPPRPKQYAVITGTREQRASLRTIECFERYYRARMEGR
jgi:hypothetical protein